MRRFVRPCWVYALIAITWNVVQHIATATEAPYAPMITCSNPQWSPDLREIVLASEPEPVKEPLRSNLCSFDLAERKLNWITHDTNVGDDRPRWSPDGTLILFERQRPPGGSARKDIYLTEKKGLSLY